MPAPKATTRLRSKTQKSKDVSGTSNGSTIPSLTDVPATEIFNYSAEPDVSMLSDTDGSSEMRRSRRARAKLVSYAEEDLGQTQTEASQAPSRTTRRQKATTKATQSDSDYSDAAASESGQVPETPLEAESTDISFASATRKTIDASDDEDYQGVLAEIDEQVKERFGTKAPGALKRTTKAATTKAAASKVVSKRVQDESMQDENAKPLATKRGATTRSRAVAKPVPAPKTTRPVRKPIGTRSRTTRNGDSQKALDAGKETDETEFAESEAERASVSEMQGDRTSMHSDVDGSVLDQDASDNVVREATNGKGKGKAPISARSSVASDDGRDPDEGSTSNVPEAILGIRNEPGFTDHISVRKMVLELPAGEMGLTDVEGRMRLERYLEVEKERYCELLEERREETWEMLMVEHGKLVRWIEGLEEPDE